MKAAFYTGKENIIIKEESLKPAKEDEVKVKIAYCGICGTDLHIFKGDMDSRVGKSAVIGHECSGYVQEAGENVRGFEKGDKVVVRPLLSCGECEACKSGLGHICYNLKFLGIDTQGAFQEYWNVPGTLLHKLPKELDMRLGALAEPLAVACHDVRCGGAGPNDRVVVIGGGPIGMLISMVAMLEGADVLMSEINPFRIKLALELGIRVINPLENDIAEHVEKWTHGAGADVCFEVSASKPAAKVMTELVKARGRIVIVGIYTTPPEVDLKKAFLRELNFIGTRVYEYEDYEKAISLIEEGKLPLLKLVTDIYALDDIQTAFENLTGNQKAVKTLIKCMEENDDT